MAEDAWDWTKRELARVVDEHKEGKRSTDFPAPTETPDAPQDQVIAKELSDTEAQFQRLLVPNWLRMKNRVDLYVHFKETWSLMQRYRTLYEQSGKKHHAAQGRAHSLLHVLKEIYERDGKTLETEYIHIYVRNHKDGTPEQVIAKAKEVWEEVVRTLEEGTDGFPQKS